MKRIMSIQDISALGKCSLTVALPILSAMGIECAVVPTAVLSTHTQFQGFTFHDLTDEMEPIADHWKQQGFRFDAIYTGYLGSFRQVDIVKRYFRDFGAGAKIIVDPAMADNGKLYGGFDEAFVREMARLCAHADYLLPNITEACFLTGTPYRAPGEYDEAWIRGLLDKLAALGAKRIVLKGILLDEGKVRIAVYDAVAGKTETYVHEHLPVSSHGTGDVFASAFTGALLRGKTPVEAVQVAAQFVLASIRATMGDEGHKYGVKFEGCLAGLAASLA
jgi:pyridoxine kinase